MPLLSDQVAAYSFLTIINRLQKANMLYQLLSLSSLGSENFTVPYVYTLYYSLVDNRKKAANIIDMGFKW